ncbi:MAG: SDR family NAD(P)-dependent oxidoreductase [Methylococcaceae bacterium]|nr:SDR family NAD(P)-dependent oxidoreductase [Methylococcaceae bacterium]
MPLSKQVILITGAGGGLGSTAALALAKLGAQIILLDKSLPKLEKIYDAVIAAQAPEPIIYPFDLNGANEQDYHDLALRIVEKYGALQGLLHSAAEFKAFTPLSCLSSIEWAHGINVNLNAPFMLTKVLLPILEKSPYASIVFTSDSAVNKAPAYAGVYGVAKIALQGFAHILAAELESAQKIRVNTLIPGPIDSPQRKRAYPGEDKTKLPDLESLAPVYEYLFSSASIGITGHTIDARTFHL